MRFLISYFIITFCIIQTVLGQVHDLAPTGRQNFLPVEGGGIIMVIDSLTPLNILIARLENNWELNETGKGYWIGYTEDMFSIASRGDSAINALMHYFKKSQSKKAKIGVIYTLHLIGINRRIVGRFYEKFINEKARDALHKLLYEPEFTYSVIKLLIRDPWKSDISAYFDILQNNRYSYNWWPIVNSLHRYNINGLPINDSLTQKLESLNISLTEANENISGSKNNFDTQIKDALIRFNKTYPDIIKFEKELLNERISGNYSTNLLGTLNINEFIRKLGIERNYVFSYSNFGCKIQYYLEKAELHFCTIESARNRLINWWNKLLVPEKSAFK